MNVMKTLKEKVTGPILTIGMLAILSGCSTKPWEVVSKYNIPSHVEDSMDALDILALPGILPPNPVQIPDQYILELGRQETINIKGMPTPYWNSKIVNVGKELYNSLEPGNVYPN
jgi:hypothetical protein